MRLPCDSDLTDEQWEILKPFLEQRHIFGWGRPRNADLREVMNAILYLNKTGCQWRSLPHDFPVWSVVFYYFFDCSRGTVRPRSSVAQPPAAGDPPKS